MTTKLTLSLDTQIIAKAKRYAAKRHLSLSRLVETYFRNIVAQEEPETRQGSIVAELAGILRKKKIPSTSARLKHLMKKHS